MEEAEAPARRNPAVSLTDDLLVEILRRLPVRSVCRFKCVSRSWRKLISDPAHRKKLPQTLTGFFYPSFNDERFPIKAHHFTNVTGKGAPFVFSYLPVSGDDLLLLDSCNGLLLCGLFEPGRNVDDETPPFQYAVCNPATEKWVTLPDGSRASGEARTARLAFDPAVSSHFHVVEYVLDEGDCPVGVEIYSSKTAAWSYKESEWGNDELVLGDTSRGVFLNGFMHMLTYPNRMIIAVDMEGKKWMTISAPFGGVCDSIHQTQGRLCFVNVEGFHASKLSIWILEDHGTHEWTLKHSVRTLLLFGQKNFPFDMGYRVITVHPEYNLIYFVYGWDTTLMAYEMDRKEVRVICNLGHDCREPYLPYGPFFSEALGDEQ